MLVPVRSQTSSPHKQYIELLVLPEAAAAHPNFCSFQKSSKEEILWHCDFQRPLISVNRIALLKPISFFRNVAGKTSCWYFAIKCISLCRNFALKAYLKHFLNFTLKNLIFKNPVIHTWRNAYII